MKKRKFVETFEEDGDSRPPKKRKVCEVKKKRVQYDWYRHIGSPKYMLAPMVKASDLGFRVLCGRHGSDLVYTPMIHSKNYLLSKTFRKKHFQSCDEDHPLCVQFCGDDEGILHEAMKKTLEMEEEMLKNHELSHRNIVSFSLNLGCPQRIANKGHYGAFLMEEQKLIERLVHHLSQSDELHVPLTCKIRKFDDFDRTLQYAQMLVKSGASMIVVHGRTRKQKGDGACDLDMVRRIKECIHDVPIILNGISSIVSNRDDIDRYLNESQCDGVMLANGLLTDPSIFERKDEHSYFYQTYQQKYQHVPIRPSFQFDLCEEYFDIVDSLVVPKKRDFSIIKGHIFKMIHKEFEMNPILRGTFYSQTSDMKTCRLIVNEMKHRAIYNFHEIRTNSSNIIIPPNVLPHVENFESLNQNIQKFKNIYKEKRKVRKMKKIGALENEEKEEKKNNN